jgi:hypothetical protein
MKTNNVPVGVYDSTAHRKGKLIHEHDFVKVRTKQAKTFPVMTAPGYTAETFATRLVRNIDTGKYK